MNFRRLTEENDDMFLKAFALYKTSFPEYEQRNEKEQIDTLAVNEYHFGVIYDENEFVGLLLFWETESFIYVEHFCIDTTIRGKGYGKQALSLLGETNKTIILEIDPPVDEISLRRQSFYLKAGYAPNAFQHIHPPYKTNHKGHKLVVLSSPKALTNEEYKIFDTYLNNTVMRKNNSLC